MSDDRYRQLVRSGLAPLLEDVSDGPEWSELKQSSPTRRTARSMPGWAVAVGTAAVVFGIFGATALLMPRGDPPTAPATPPTPTPQVLEPTDDEPPVLDQETGSFVYLSTDTRLTVVDVDAGLAAVHELPELAPGDPQYRLVRRGDKLVFYGGTDLGPAVYSLDPAAPTSPTLVDDNAWFFVPSAVEDRVWIAVLDLSSPDTVRALEVLREVTVDGVVTVEGVLPPDGRWPVAAVDDGLIFQGDDVLEVWDPETQEFVDTLPGPFPVAAWGNRIVTCGQCDELELIDLDAGSHRTIDIPDSVAHVDGYGGAFSPDGRYMAVPGWMSPGIITPDTGMALVLVDFEAGTASLVSGIPQDLNAYAQVVWSSSGDWLFYSVGALRAETGRLFAYRPGDDTAYRVPVLLDGQYYGMETN